MVDIIYRRYMNIIQNITYDLLFDNNDDFEFDLSMSLEDINDCTDLISSIVTNINKGGVEVIRDFIKVDGKKVYWNVKIKRS